MEDRSALRSLTDRQLVNALTTLAVFERAAIAKLVAALAEFDRRRLFLPLGFTSLFAYCTNRLGLSQDEAFFRIEAARIARRFPVVLDYLEKGAVNLTTVRLLGPHLTIENQAGLLDAASHQKKPEVEVLIARLRPKPDVPSTIRKLPAVASTHQTHASTRQSHASTHQSQAADMPAQVAPAPPAEGPGPALLLEPQPHRMELEPHRMELEPHRMELEPHRMESQHRMDSEPRRPGPPDIRSRRPVIAPLSETSYRLQITISKTSHDTLRQIQSLIRHVIPTGDPAAIVERSLDLLLAELKKKKSAHVSRPQRQRDVKPRGRYVPANVKRRVWTRDEGRCAFVSGEGVRCTEDGFLEYHHVKPYAKGGGATVDNIQLRCRAHNAHESELVFGARQPR